MKSIRLVFLTPVLLTLTSLVWAHDNATLDTTKAPNGGQLRMAGPYHFELLVAPPGKHAKAATVVIFVTDHDSAKVPTAGATGTATLLGSGNKTTLTLKPESDNRMKGEGTYLSSTDMKVIVSIRLAGVPAESARFTPWSRTEANAHGERK